MNSSGGDGRSVPAGSTGYFSNKYPGAYYIHNGDPTVEQRMKELEQQKKDDGGAGAQPTPPAPGTNVAPPAQQPVPGPAPAPPSSKATGSSINGSPPASTQPPGKEKLKYPPLAVPQSTNASGIMPAGQRLVDQLNEFDLARYGDRDCNGSDKNERKHFGRCTFKLRVWFMGHDSNPIIFGGRLTPAGPPNQYIVAAEHFGYHIQGTLIDNFDTQKSVGLFTLYNDNTHESAEIHLKAFRADLTVHLDQEHKLADNSPLACQIKALDDHAFGWGYNWSVIGGKAFYWDDIVRVIKTDEVLNGCLPPEFSFRGESLSTATDDDVYEFPTEMVKDHLEKTAATGTGARGGEATAKDSAKTAEAMASTVDKVKLVGNSTRGGRRAFDVTFKDAKSGESINALVDFEETNPDDGPEIKPEEEPTIYTAIGDPSRAGTDSQTVTPEQPDDLDGLGADADAPGSTTSPAGPSGPVAGNGKGASRPPTRPHPASSRPRLSQRQRGQGAVGGSDPATIPLPPPRPAPERQVPLGTVAGGYLKTDLTLARSRKMIQDFDKNYEIGGVRKAIADYQKGAASLRNFFDYANPFRGLLEEIGRTLDVSPVYAYLTVVESHYFTRRRYEIEHATGTTALGPFQMVIGTARKNGLRVYESEGPGDERRYFAPSACGAARYMITLADMFKDKDTTVSILGYFQGEGGASAALYCAFSSEQAGHRQGCTSRINHGGFSHNQYAHFMKLIHRYDYSYIKMERMGTLTKAMTDYVNKKLAVYFIAANMARYGFALTSAAQTRRPEPSSGFNIRIYNPTCQSIVDRVKTREVRAAQD